MAASYEEVDLLDMELDQAEEVLRYPCPCGDKFFITVEELFDNEDKATCPSCSLILKVEFDEEKLERIVKVLDNAASIDDNNLNSNNDNNNGQDE